MVWNNKFNRLFLEKTPYSVLFSDISLMERLMKAEPYQPINYTFNDRYIVLLIENYRSHSAILRPSNELFYGSNLIAKAPIGKHYHFKLN